MKGGSSILEPESNTLQYLLSWYFKKFKTSSLSIKKKSREKKSVQKDSKSVEWKFHNKKYCTQGERVLKRFSTRSILLTKPTWHFNCDQNCETIQSHESPRNKAPWISDYRSYNNTESEFTALNVGYSTLADSKLTPTGNTELKWRPNHKRPLFVPSSCSNAP